MHTARDLTNRLAALLRDERRAMADFLLALAEFDRRRLWVDLGHANLFTFLHVELGLSRGAAHYRKTAVGLVQQFPELVEPLRDGRLCITSVVELAKVITPENLAEVLPRFFHCSKREAKEISAELCPRPVPAHDLVTKVTRHDQATARDETRDAPLFPGSSGSPAGSTTTSPRGRSSATIGWTASAGSLPRLRRHEPAAAPTRVAQRIARVRDREYDES